MTPWLVELARTAVDEFDPERRLPGAGRASDHHHVPAWDAAEQDVIEPANPGLDEIISLRHEPPPPSFRLFARSDREQALQHQALAVADCIQVLRAVAATLEEEEMHFLRTSVLDNDRNGHPTLNTGAGIRGSCVV
jgi:hypothetical protein